MQSLLYISYWCCNNVGLIYQDKRIAILMGDGIQILLCSCRVKGLLGFKDRQLLFLQISLNCHYNGKFNILYTFLIYRHAHGLCSPVCKTWDTPYLKKLLWIIVLKVWVKYQLYTCLAKNLFAQPRQANSWSYEDIFW